MTLKIHTPESDWVWNQILIVLVSESGGLRPHLPPSMYLLTSTAWHLSWRVWRGWECGIRTWTTFNFRDPNLSKYVYQPQNHGSRCSNTGNTHNMSTTGCGNESLPTLQDGWVGNERRGGQGQTSASAWVGTSANQLMLWPAQWAPQSRLQRRCITDLRREVSAETLRPASPHLTVCCWNYIHLEEKCPLGTTVENRLSKYNRSSYDLLSLCRVTEP